MIFPLILKQSRSFHALDFYTVVLIFSPSFTSRNISVSRVEWNRKNDDKNSVSSAMNANEGR